MLKREGRKAQLTIIIIVAIVIVLGIIVYFAFREKISAENIPAEFVPVYNYYSSCIEKEAREAIELAGSQGGQVYVDDYVQGSDYAPSSSQLNFLGFPVPYWYYISGNGIISEQAPLKSDIENEIALYVESGIKNCNMEQFYLQGYSIDFSDASAKVKIDDDKVTVDFDSDVYVSSENNSALKSKHEVVIDSKLGKFYGIAKEIYNKEKREAFLENYSTDVLRLYAPVDGVEITCAPKVWKTREVVDELKSGLEANIAALKFRGDYYSLNDKESKYFIINQDVDENVNLIYSRSWPTKVNIVGEGVDDEIMIAESVGTQQGLGVLGFCYAPYHYVYDVSFPVMIQVYDDDELFQFPVVVVIDKNLPRQGEFSIINESESFDVCAFKTQDINVNVYDVNLNPVDADISYECFNQKCALGESQSGKFTGKTPACVNGYLHVRAENYTEVKQIFSSNEETSADVILDREFDVNIELSVGGKELNGMAVVSFNGPKSVSAALPEINSLRLSEGLYNISVYVYGNSSIKIPASTKTQCVDIAQTGISGLFGGTKEQCYDITIPETNVDYALIGGGKIETYLLASDLEDGKIKINANAFNIPGTLEELQYNYGAVEQGGVFIE